MYKWKNKRQYRNEIEAEDAPSPTLQPVLINMGGEQTQVSASIRVIENKIFFYGEIEMQSMLELNRILVETNIKLQNTRNVLGPDYSPIIHLHLNTPGGSLMDAFSCVDTIRGLKTPVYTYVDGMVASAGTLICSVGAKRHIGENGHMLIHQLSSMMGGTMAEMEDTFLNVTNLMKLIKDFYKKYTKIPMKKLDEILKHDLYMNAKECQSYGLVDTIL